MIAFGFYGGVTFGLFIGTMFGVFIAGLMSVARERDRDEQIRRAHRRLRELQR